MTNVNVQEFSARIIAAVPAHLRDYAASAARRIARYMEESDEDFPMVRERLVMEIEEAILFAAGLAYTEHHAEPRR